VRQDFDENRPRAASSGVRPPDALTSRRKIDPYKGGMQQHVSFARLSDLELTNEVHRLIASERHII
jgi:hypothetical protein